MKNILNIDDPKTTIQNGKTIRRKLFLQNLYTDFYHDFQRSISSFSKNAIVVELGSGGGFIKKIIPKTITSDILPLPDSDKTFSALSMPFRKSSVDAFFMINVLHHLKDADRFFKEASRTLKKNGKIVMIEPSNTLWGGFVYSHFHYEPFDTTSHWKMNVTGPLSGANDALPWIIFFRDREKFERKYHHLQINRIEAHTPIRYLLSGGVKYPQLLPSSLYPVVLWIEKILSPLNKYIGMFYTIELEKTRQ